MAFPSPFWLVWGIAKPHDVIRVINERCPLPLPPNPILQWIPLRNRRIPGPPWCYPGNSWAPFVIQRIVAPMGTAGNNRENQLVVFQGIHGPCCHSGNYRTNQGYSRESRAPRCRSGNSIAAGVFQGFPDPRLSFQGVLFPTRGIPWNSRTLANIQGITVSTMAIPGNSGPRVLIQGVLNPSWGIPGNSRDPNR